MAHIASDVERLPTLTTAGLLMDERFAGVSIANGHILILPLNPSRRQATAVTNITTAVRNITS
jgi:hypothetical protein